MFSSRRRRMDELVNGFIAAKAASGRSSRTLARYRTVLGRLAARSPSLPDGACVAQFLAGVQGEPETLDTYYRTLGVFFKWAGRPEVLNGISAPKLRRKIGRTLTVGEMRQVVAAARSPWQKALVLLLLDTGCRIGELVGVRKSDIVGNILVLGLGKTGQRAVPLSCAVAGVLRSLPSTTYLFPKLRRGGTPVENEPGSVSGLRATVARAMRRAGLVGAKVGPHALRHSFATEWISTGGDVISLARILGHTSTRMTERYVDLNAEQLRDKHTRYSAFGAAMGVGVADLLVDDSDSSPGPADAPAARRRAYDGFPEPDTDPPPEWYFPDYDPFDEPDVYLGYGLISSGTYGPIVEWHNKITVQMAPGVAFSGTTLAGHLCRGVLSCGYSMTFARYLWDKIAASWGKDPGYAS